MGARYGRNQKRRHRERIAELEAMYGGWPSPAEVRTEGRVPEHLILSIYDQTDEERGEGRKRFVDLRLLATSGLERLLAETYRRMRWLEWRGAAWKLVHLEMEEADEDVIARIRLHAWAGRTIGKVR